MKNQKEDTGRMLEQMNRRHEEMLERMDRRPEEIMNRIAQLITAKSEGIKGLIRI